MTVTREGFVAWGYVTGAALHPGFRLGDRDSWFELTTDLPASFRRIDPPGVVEVKAPGGYYVTGVKRQPRVGSRVAFRLSVFAEDSDAAFAKADRELLPIYLAGLSSVAEEPLYATVVALHRLGDDEGWLSRMSSAEVMVTPSPRFLSDDEVQNLVPGLVWAAQHDATARLAAADFHAANMYSASSSGTLADVQAILSTYYFVIERIARRINKELPLNLEPTSAMRHVNALQQSLAASMDLDEQLSQIGLTHRKLQELRLRGMKKRIRHAGDELGVESSHVTTAVRFTDLRNERLGHPARLDEQARDLGPWTLRAQETAMAYLAGYLRRVSNLDLADPAE